MKSDVITSYSIHYTKLYDFYCMTGFIGSFTIVYLKLKWQFVLLNHADCTAFHPYCTIMPVVDFHIFFNQVKILRNFQDLLFFHLTEGVITSYSIHYTKLYDFGYYESVQYQNRIEAYHLRPENTAYIVITSYSIHYTKLYEPLTRPFSFLGRSGPVITSYSIHYTKLYDCGKATLTGWG